MFKVVSSKASNVDGHVHQHVSLSACRIVLSLSFLAQK